MILGVDIDLPEHPTDEQAAKAAADFLKTYANHMDNAPVYCCTLIMPQNVREKLYIQSRQMFES